LAALADRDDGLLQINHVPKNDGGDHGGSTRLRGATGFMRSMPEFPEPVIHACQLIDAGLLNVGRVTLWRTPAG
jgi:hypothetical protein